MLRPFCRYPQTKRDMSFGYCVAVREISLRLLTVRDTCVTAVWKLKRKTSLCILRNPCDKLQSRRVNSNCYYASPITLQRLRKFCAKRANSAFKAFNRCFRNARNVFIGHPIFGNSDRNVGIEFSSKPANRQKIAFFRN